MSSENMYFCEVVWSVQTGKDDTRPVGPDKHFSAYSLPGDADVQSRHTCTDLVIDSLALGIAYCPTTNYYMQSQTR